MKKRLSADRLLFPTPQGYRRLGSTVADAYSVGVPLKEQS